jgi:hypothetical protein
MAEQRARIDALLADRPDVSVRVLAEQPAGRRLLVAVGPVAGLGWATWPAAAAAPPPPVVVGERSLDNGLIALVVDPDRGTFSINGMAGFDRLVDSGDHGDTYNWCPPEHDVVVAAPDLVAVSVLEEGPLRGRLLVERRFTWPERTDDATRTRVGAVTVDVRTTIEVRAGEAVVHVHTSFRNPARDHRLRAHFPLPTAASSSRAECAFTTVERGLVAEGGITEAALATYPSRRFVQAGGLTVAHEGLLEYELVDIDGAGAATLALTLLRATGMLSRVDLALRPLPAGPPLPLEGPQMLGPVEARYSLSVDPSVDPYALVDAAFLPLLPARAEGGGDRPASGSALEIEGAEVSAVQRVGGALEVRLWNPSADEREVRIEGRRGWLVDLRGRPLATLDGSFPLRGWGIATVRLRP